MEPTLAIPFVRHALRAIATGARRWRRLGLGAALGLALCSCAAPGASPARAERAAIDARIDAIVGEPIVVFADPDQFDPRSPPVVRLDDGRVLAASWHWLTVAPEPGAPARWLPPTGRWSSVPADGREPPPDAALVLVVEPPVDAIGQGLWIDRRRIALNWIAEAPPRAEPPRPPAPRSIPPQVERVLEPERRHPYRRWRYHLVMGTLGARVAPSQATPADAFDDPAVEALARHVEARWRAGLVWLRHADPDLAERLRAHLGALVDFGGGVLAPAWPTDPIALDTLLGDLLDPLLSNEARARRIRLWLDEQPAAAAWIIDDAGVTDAATGRPTAMVGIANLADRPAVAWAAPEGDAGAPELVPVPSLSVRHLPVVAPEPATDTSWPASGAPTPTGPTPIGVGLGAWAASRAAILQRVPLEPPGLAIGPLAPDWSMVSWIDSAPVPAADPDWATAALLHRDPSPGAARWVLYVECRTPRGLAPTGESLRVWLGPFRRPLAVLRVNADGSASVDSSLPGTSPDPGAVRVHRQADRWTAHIPIPDSCVEPDGTLRLGLERTDALGRRWAWPRPMLPWQTEPGRLAADTTRWGSIAPPRPPLPR